MILGNQVEWALHCCLVMASLPDGKYISTKALAEFHGVPKEYLSKALQAVSQAGLVKTTLGPKGGYRLARLPEEISFLDVIEAVEGRSYSFKCTEIRANNPCMTKPVQFSKPCLIARVMHEADDAWRATLKRVTLADAERTLGEDVLERDLKVARDWLLTF